MYTFAEIETEYGYPVESRIIHFLEFYDIPKENILNIRFINSHRATIIFDTNGTMYEEIQNRRIENAIMVE